MAKLTSRLEGNKVIFRIEIEPKEKQDWCVTVSSKTNLAAGFDIPVVSKILEYSFKAEKFCGKGSQEIKKQYISPGQYLAILEIGGEEIRSISGPLITRFEITGFVITDKDVISAKELLECMAEIYTKNKQKEETVFDNVMLNPFFDSLASMLENVINKRDIYAYVDDHRNNIILLGPTIKEGKYFWPILHEGKYVPSP